MADVFLSYASEDRERIAPLAAALVAAGHSLWWDRDIKPGADFAQTIEREIALARVVIVAWSQASARSQWVRDEAAFGRDAGILLPLLLDVREPPMGFRQVQAIDFRAWHGDAQAPAFVALADAIKALLGGQGMALPLSRNDARPVHATGSSRARPVALGVAVLLATLGAAVLVNHFGLSPASPAIASGEVLVERFRANPPDQARDARAAGYAAAFSSRFTESGIRNVVEGRQPTGSESEFSLSGELGATDEREFLTVSIDDRASGASLWSIRREPTEGAAWESSLAAFALKCALERRHPQTTSHIVSRYIHACASFLDGDYLAQYDAASDIHAALPDDPRATAFLAFASVAFGWAQTSSPTEHERLVNEGKRLAEQVLAADPQNAEALFAMGFAYDDYHFSEQEHYWRAAIEADPEFGPALGRYSRLLLTVGRLREASDYLARAQRQRPLPDGTLARLMAADGNWEQARALYARIRPFDPVEIDRHELVTAVLYGDIEEAARALQQRPELAGSDEPCFRQLLAARRKESIDRARFTAICGGQGMFSARFLALAGDIDGAYRALEPLLKHRELRFPPQLFWPEMRDFLRDERFWPLAAEIGLVAYWSETQQWPEFCAEPDLPFDCRQRAAAAPTSRDPAAPGV